MTDDPDVLLVCNDPNWLMTISEALGQITARKYQSAPTVFAELKGDRHAVVVAGPAAYDELLAAPPEVRADPGVALVAIVETLDVDLIRQAMVSGIDEVLEAGQLDDLAPTVQRLWVRVNRFRHEPSVVPQRPGKVTLVTSTKGGQGTTTVSVNLALALSKRGPTALIEGDPRYGDLIDALGYRQLHHELVRANLFPGHWLDSFTFRHPSGLVVVLPRQDAADELAPSDIIEAIGTMQDRFEHTVIDAPLWSVLMNQLNRVADAVLLVTSGRERDVARLPLAVSDLALTRGTVELVVSGVGEGETVKAREIGRISGLETAGIIPWDDRGEKAFESGRSLSDVVPAASIAFESLAGEVERLLR